MSLSKLLAKMQLSQADAEVIFDRDEPVGEPTDLVMPRRRWFRRSSKRASDDGSGVPPRRTIDTKNFRREGAPDPSVRSDSESEARLIPIGQKS